MQDQIIKTRTGFSQECDLMTLEWDHRGKYRGQWQDDALGAMDVVRFSHGSFGGFDANEISHWMPLPEPPK